MSSRNLKAIETGYKGYRFRSRLEARWAVFFDAMRVGWEYEREGFDLGEAGLYLPDFWISPIHFRDKRYEGGCPPTPGWWVEIKPTELTAGEETLCSELAMTTGHVVYALAGNIGATEFKTYKWHPRHPNLGGIKVRSINQDMWMFDEYYQDVFLYYLCTQSTQIESGKRELDAAFKAARSARFEHGEAPRL